MVMMITKRTDPRARIETNGQYINLKTAYGEVGQGCGLGRSNASDIIARDFITSAANNPTYHHADRWETPRDGNRGLVIASPNGTGAFYVCTPEQWTAFYRVWACAFVVSSSEKFKDEHSEIGTSRL